MALRRRSKDDRPDFFPGFADVVEIGAGSLSILYRARETATDRWFALKLLAPADATAWALGSFEGETAALRSLSVHPNIVDVYGSFRAPDGRPVLVLELCSTSVAALMPGGAGLPVRDVVSLGVKIAGALETAHRAGTLHGDVRPQNILVTQAGQPALGDFGLSMLRSSSQLTAGRINARTMHAAPELLGGAAACAAGDVYGLAATLYQLIAGQPAFPVHGGEPPLVLLKRIADDPVPPLTDRQAPPRLSDLLVYSMSKDPAVRPPSAAEFAAELGAVEGEQQWPRTKLVVRDVPVPVPRPVRPEPAPSAPPPAANPGWTPPPAEEWFGGDAPMRPATPALDSTDWSEPTRSAPRHARPDDDDPADTTAMPTPAAPEPDAASAEDPGAAGRLDVPSAPGTDGAGDPKPDVDDDGLSADEYAAFDAAAALAPPTTVNPVMPRAKDGGGWSDISLSNPSNPPDAAAEQVQGAPPEDGSLDMPDPGRTTAHPVWRQARLAASTTEAASNNAPLPTERIPDPAVARYPIPPATGDGDQQPGEVPSWAFREPAQAPPAAPFGSDLTLDPMSLRRRVTIRSGGHALIVDDARLVVRAWWRRTRLAWPDVLGFEPRFDGVGTSGSGGRLVAITRNGPVELPATKRSMADLRYVQALLDAYRHRSQMPVDG